MSTGRRTRLSKRRLTTSTPISPAPGPGTATTASAAVSATHAASSGGSNSNIDDASLGCTRSDPPPVSSRWTIAEPEANGATFPSGVPKTSVSESAASVRTSMVAGEPQAALTVRVTVRRTASTCAARASAAAAAANASR